MARVRGPSYRSCFYCGKRTKSKYEPGTREFLCWNCEATNYLDENGEITDPPVATEREVATTQYAVPATSSSLQTDSIFCATCLKNQRLFTASLAQYLPDDPSDPDYAELERNYYRYRRGLEKRYPQVCDDCAAKVDDRIRQAGFTAKTDHLRRMMERSSGRKAARRRTPLDLVNTVGMWLWRIGLALQLLWHLKVVAEVLHQTDNGMHDPDNRGMPVIVNKGLQSVVGYLPSPDALIRGSIAASILCVWWNPHFVQVNRGFTRHLLGFTQWYAFQGLIIFFRFIFRAVLDIKGGKAQSRNTQISTHLVMAAVMCLIYHQAGRSIKVNTTALFESHSGTVSPASGLSPARRKEEDGMTFSDLLNEALDTPATSPQKGASSHQYENPVSPARAANHSVRTAPSSERQFSSLNLSDPSTGHVAKADYGDEMDWTPTTSPHRAFKDFSPRQGSQNVQAFGQAPMQPESSAFWYKVPPAPAAPARKMRNPRVPVVRADPGEKQSSSFFRQAGESHATKQNREHVGVDFDQPRFFAQEKGQDEDANSLADLLGKSFSLSQEEERRGQSSAKPSMWSVASDATKRSGPRSSSPLEPLVLACLMTVWIVTSYLALPYAAEAQILCLFAAGMIALRATGEAGEVDDNERQLNLMAILRSAVGVAELATLCCVGWEKWMERESEALDLYGGGVLAVMLGHYSWNWATR